jgi:diacylglycerol kinase (ATP)
MGVHAALAVHPGSGSGAAGRVSGTVASILRDAVDRLDLVVADTIEESHALMRAARDAGLDALVVLGGDGSMHQGVQFCAGTDIALGVIPAGTGNDFARALDISADSVRAAGQIADALAHGRSRRLDLGRVDSGEWFATVLCAGFDAAVNARANALSWPRGARRYDAAVVSEFTRFAARHVVIRTADEVLELDATMVEIGNTAYYGGGIPICPTADPSDGLFDVTVVGRLSKLDLIRTLPTLRTGKHAENPAVRMFRADSVELIGDPSWLAYADGDPVGSLPLKATCVHEALSVLL